MYVLLQKRDQLTAFIYNHLMSESLPLSGVVQIITIPLFQNIHMNGLMIHETLLAKCRNSGSAIIAECNMFHTKCMLQCFGSLHMMNFFFFLMLN